MKNFRCNISYNIFYSNRILRVNKAMKFIKFKAYRYYIKEKNKRGDLKNKFEIRRDEAN